MSTSQTVSLTDFEVRIDTTATHTVASWAGRATAAALETAVAARDRLHAESREHLVLELAHLAFVADEVLEVLVELVVESRRRGSSVTLVRCPAALHARLLAAGAAGGVWHSVSIAAATAGLVSDSGTALELNVRSDLQLMSRVCVVAAALAREAGLRGSDWEHFVVAVREGITNAMTHGSPHGLRNDIRVGCSLDAAALVVEIEDQGPGMPWDAAAAGDPESGLARIRRGADVMEYLKGSRGCLLRLTKRLGSRSRKARTN